MSGAFKKMRRGISVLAIAALAVGYFATPWEQYYAAIIALTASIGWLLAIVISLAIAISVWPRDERGLNAGAIRCIVILLFLYVASAISGHTFPQIAEWIRIASGDSAIGKYQLRVLRGGTELEYTGGITSGATDQVRSLLDADPEIRVIHLNSPGGWVGEAHKLQDLIRERKLVTYTASICASACTIAFLGGVQRIVAPWAMLGFHGGSFPGATDRELAKVNDMERRQFISIGVPAWFADLAFTTPSSSMWWPTSEELRQAGVITGMARPNDFALSRFGSEKDFRDR